MKKLILLFLAILCYGKLQSQTASDSTIIMYNTFTGIRFEQNRQEIDRADVYDMLSTNELSNLFIYKT